MTGNIIVAALGLAVTTGGAVGAWHWHAGPEAEGTFHDTSGAAVGEIDIDPAKGGGVRIEVTLHGVPPGKHGLHIHANDSCGSATDPAGPFSAAGPHFDPHHAGVHAGPDGNGHAGDLGNITVGANGKGKLELTDRRIDLGLDSTGIMGKAVVLHADADNLTNTPANGGSGARLACAVLEED